MEPGVVAGQEILVSSLPYLFSKLKTGHLIAFKDGEKFIIKRVKKINGDEVLVKGDNGKDSKDFGWIEKNRILGKVIYP